MINITLFNGEGTAKTPKSTGDGSFIFLNQETDKLKDAYAYLSDNYVLAKHLEIDEPIRNYLKVQSLKEFIPLKINTLIFDVQDITNATFFKDVIMYFKDSKYACILGKTSKWDGIYNFNIRVIIKVNVSNDNKSVESLLDKIQQDIGKKGIVSRNSRSINHCLPPTKNKYLYCKERGKTLSDLDIKVNSANELIDVLSNEEKEIQKYLDEKKNTNTELIDVCLEKFFEKGFSINQKSSQKSISFTLNGDNNYFWYKTTPFIMNHSDKAKKISIFYEIKKTKIGKEWLKTKTRAEQEKELLKPTDYAKFEKYLTVNEEFLDFTKKNKDDIIKDFLKSDKGVFKIKSAMGTGKSNGIESIIKKCHKAKEKVIIVTNRISVAKDFAEKYGIKTYQQVENGYDNGSLIVQYDSLHRFEPLKFDVVVFDEYISLLLHHRSGLTNNSNINAIKFKILSESKRVVIADAFLTGYENEFFANRKMYAVINEYRNEVELFEYKNKDYFLSRLIKDSHALKKGEHISASFTSLNIMNVVHKELKDSGIRVVSLSSETNEITKEIIYKKFKEDTHEAFQVILFTPTLTVGVSNLNNVISHYHYDSGMATDVISSLQMIKRSRAAKEIHYFIQDRQMSLDTDINSLNSISEQSINDFYKNKDKTLLIDIDYTTGELTLTPLARYINKIEVLSNILENNHGNSFRLLLNYQFIEKAQIIESVSKELDLTNKTRAIKQQLRKEKLDMLEKYADCTWDYFEIQEIKNKFNEKSNKEKTKLLMYEIQDKFSKEMPRDMLIKLAEYEIESDFTFIEHIKNMKLIMKSDLDTYAKYNLSTAISEDITSLQNKEQIKFLEYMIKLEHNFVLDTTYSKDKIKDVDFRLNRGRKFENFLKQLGYKWQGEKDNKSMISDMRIFKYLDFI